MYFWFLKLIKLILQLVNHMTFTFAVYLLYFYLTCCLPYLMYVYINLSWIQITILQPQFNCLLQQLINTLLSFNKNCQIFFIFIQLIWVLIITYIVLTDYCVNFNFSFDVSVKSFQCIIKYNIYRIEYTLYLE